MPSTPWRLSTCAPRTESGARPFQPHATPGLCSSFDESQAKNALNQLYRSKVELAQELALPVTIIIFFLIGAPLGAIVRRGGLGMPIVISVIFFVIYYIISSSGEKMAKEGTWEAFYGTWLSAFVLAPVAIYLTYKATNDSGLLDVDWYVVKFKKIKEKISGIFARFRT